MELRREFVEDYLTDAFTMTELCMAYGVSRKTGYQLVARFEAEGWRGMQARSRRPHRFARAMPAAIASAIRRARAKHPDWGARKLRGWLQRRVPETLWPGHNAIHMLLVREGLVRRARGRPRGHGGAMAGLRVPTHPNAVWTVDFKGNFRLGNRDECYPLTLRDLASRYSLRCDGLAQPDEPTVRRKTDTAFQDYGLPDAIRSDNGPPFAAGGLGGLTQLSVWWLRLGIAIEHIAPGRPEQNGSHEQFHRVLKSATTRPPAQTLRQQQQRFNRFRREYNEERPHAALGNDVPADHYMPSARPWPRRPPALDYPGHWETRRVTTNGCVRIRGVVLFVSRALNGQDISFEEIDDQLWTVHFGRFAIARWHEPDAHLRPIRIA